MRAIVHHRFGPPESVAPAEVPRPAQADDEVLVRVHAAAVNPGDVLRVGGTPYLGRLLGYGIRRPRQPVPGADLAGRIESVGTAVSGLAAGDEVLGWAAGTFAEYVAVPARQLAPKPPSVSFEQAAAVPTAGFAALQGLRDGGGLRDGDRALVIGASGGVGTLAVQIAKALGATVTGVAGTDSLELVRSAGADAVVDYRREDATGGDARYDVILDLVGNRPLRELAAVLAPGGTLVAVGSPGGRSVTGLGRFARAALRSPLTRGRRLRPLFSTPKPDDLATLAGMLADGRLLPVIDRRYPLADAGDALGHVASGHARGKVVVTIP